jgi:hypothetical protein
LWANNSPSEKHPIFHPRAREVPLGDLWRSEVLDAKIVIDGMMKFLLASEVTLGRLNRCVAEQKLYLL